MNLTLWGLIHDSSPSLLVQYSTLHYYFARTTRSEIITSIAVIIKGKYFIFTMYTPVSLLIMCISTSDYKWQHHYYSDLFAACFFNRMLKLNVKSFHDLKKKRLPLISGWCCWRICLISYCLKRQTNKHTNHPGSNYCIFINKAVQGITV